MNDTIKVRTLRRVLVANRGAVAARVIRALRQLGIASVAVYSDADAGLPYLREADMAVRIGEAAPLDSYLHQAKAARCRPGRPARTACTPAMASCRKTPTSPNGWRRRGSALSARRPPGSAVWATRRRRATSWPATACRWRRVPACCRTTWPWWLAAAGQIGYPVLIKPAGGGGGIGMLPVRDAQGLAAAWQQARSVAQRSFGQAELYLEKLMEQPRHIEFQVLADRYGGVRIVGERDCSVQRRHQKVLEEAPARATCRPRRWPPCASGWPRCWATSATT